MNLSVFTESALIEGDISIASSSVKGEALLALIEQKLQSIQDGVNSGKLYHVHLNRKKPEVEPKKGDPLELVFFTENPTDMVSPPRKGIGLLNHGGPISHQIQSVVLRISTDGMPEVELTYLTHTQATIGLESVRSTHPITAFRMMTQREYSNLAST